MSSRILSGWAVGVVVLLTLGLAACSSGSADDPGFIHIEEGAEETAIAQTAIALASATPTPGPSPTPVPTGTPYAIPTNPPDLDASMVITRVGNTDLTLEDYQKYVRFDRYRLLYPIVKLVERHGPERILDLSNSDNDYVAGLLVTLADSYSLGSQSHRLMIIDQIALQEARRRGLDVNTQQFDAKLLGFLGLIVGENGQMPPEFEERYDEFLEGLETYAGMTEEEFRKIVRARTLYSQLEFIMSHEPGVVDLEQTARVGVQVQDIVLPELETAEAVVERLEAGEALRDVAQSLGYNPASEEEWRVLRWSEEGITEDVRQAVVKAAPNDVIGPIEIPQGYYVARVGTEVFDVLSPEDVDALRKDYFLNWVESQMDDPEYVIDYDNWLDYTPQEPLPHDVSPLLRDENFTLPDDEQAAIFEQIFGLTPELPGAEADGEAEEPGSAG